MDNKKVTTILKFLLGGFVLVYIILKSYSYGTDIDIYLYASRQILLHENIYASHPLYNYFYSPLFALLLAPMSFLEDAFARVIWALLNTAATVRIAFLLKKWLTEELILHHTVLKKWYIATLVLSLGFLNHNLILGQITIIILWLSIEGFYQILILQKKNLGALLIALGINIKIIPILGLYYLFFKKEYRAVAACVLLVIGSLFLPAAFLGYDYNTELLSQWKEQINPAQENFVFENTSGCYSLNAILPAFFYDNNDAITIKNSLFCRKIAFFSYQNLFFILQALRLLLVLSLLFLIYHRHQQRVFRQFYLYWEISYLFLLTFLIFPHQLKYAMLYFVPAGSYIILYIFLRLDYPVPIKSFREKSVLGITAIILFILAVMGRDIIGDNLVDFLGFYHFLGLSCLLFLALLWHFKPSKLISLISLSLSDK